MTYHAINFKQIGTTPHQQAFTVVCNSGEAVIPGFTTYGGRLQSPAKYFKGNWYPCISFSQEEAEALYRGVAPDFPEGALLLPIAQAVEPLVYNDATLARLGVV